MTSTFLPCLRRILPVLALLMGAGSAQADIPVSQRQYLLDFYAASGGAGWLDKTGWDTSLPGTECSWFGVFCDGGGTTVVGLQLTGNNLVSPPGIPVPDWSSALPDLQSLLLNANGLRGPVPPIAALPQFLVFDISQNQFTGTLPDPSGLQFLQRYYVYENQFTGGIAPLINLPSLLSYAVHGNRLTGPAPAAPSSLTPNQSALCPNHLTPSTSAGWDIATGKTPWHADCTAAPPGLGGATAVPTLGDWALALLILAAVALGLAALRRERG